MRNGSHRIGMVLLVCSWLPLTSAAQGTAGALNWSCHAVQTVPVGEPHRAPVVSGVSLQPGGALLAVVGDNHVVNIYDRQLGEFVHHLSRHSDWIRCARFSPDGQTLATGGNDGRIMLWPTADFSQPRQLVVDSDPVVDLRYSGDGEKIVAVGFADRLRVYDVSSGRMLLQLTCPCADMRTVAFSRDDQLLAAAGRNGTIQLWDAETGESLAQFKAHRGRIRAIEFTDDGRIVSCGDDRNINVSDTQGTSKTVARLNSKLFALAVLGPGLVAASGSGNTIHIWNLDTLQASGQLDGHTGSVSCLDVRDRMLVSGSFDTHFRIWTTERVAALRNDAR